MISHNVTSIPVVDYEVIKFLRSFDRDGSDDFLQRLADLYIKQTPIDLARLKAIASTNDMKAVIHQARLIRHRNENLGCLRMVHYLDQIAALARTTPGELTFLFDMLFEESELVSLALAELTGVSALSENLVCVS